MKKILFFIIIIVALAAGPYNTSKEKATKITGKVKSISDGGIKDLVFELENQKTTYYINRALENGFNLNKVNTNFNGQTAVIYYIKSWTPLAPFGKKSEHIYQISINDSIIYSEWK